MLKTGIYKGTIKIDYPIVKWTLMPPEIDTFNLDLEIVGYDTGKLHENIVGGIIIHNEDYENKFKTLTVNFKPAKYFDPPANGCVFSYWKNDTMPEDISSDDEVYFNKLKERANGKGFFFISNRRYCSEINFMIFEPDIPIDVNNKNN